MKKTKCCPIGETGNLRLIKNYCGKRKEMVSMTLIIAMGVLYTLLGAAYVIAQ